MQHPYTFASSDERIRYVHLELERDLPASFQERPLPEGYHYCFYKPGDRDHWIEIEIAAKEIKDHEQGIQVWEKYYGAYESILPQRMFFIETDAGEKVATATAIFNTFGEDDGHLGWLHWVAVKGSYQGKGLSKPLIAHTLNRLIELGYQRAHIPTQTSTWVAVKIYLDFGFQPSNADTALEGWEIARTLTNHPSLASFKEAPWEKVLRKE